jgi:hypothetical protein
MERQRKTAVLLPLLFFLSAFSLCVQAYGITEDPKLVPLRRFAFIVGSNQGSGVRIPLQYATSDAKSFAQVLLEMGGLNWEDSVILLDPSYVEFSQGMRKINGMVADASAYNERIEFLFYYSGHSDEEGLLLGQNRYSYKKLRSDITEISADVHIAIVDSCSSGALTRSKGGVRKPAFLIDASNITEGHAFLTSSSADEAAQESDRIKASFFTHYLVSGLRGAADSTNDGRVTLNEAYHYAFNETLASTEKTRYGAQHPTYDISLTGTGDIVLTDLRNTSASLTIAKDVSGRLFVRDHYGSLVAELNKQYGRQIDLGLREGPYEITLNTGSQTYQAQVAVAAGQNTLLDSSDLQPAVIETTAARGSNEIEDSEADNFEEFSEEDWEYEFEFEDESEDTFDDELAAEREQDDVVYERQIARFGVTPTVALPSLDEGLPTVSHLSFNLLWGSSYRIEGLELALGGNNAEEDVIGSQIALISNTLGGSLVGAQITAFHNHVKHEMRGVQLSGLINRSDLHAYGAQVSGLVNFTKGDMIGFQTAGLISITQGSLIGAQISGIANYADYTGGLQLGFLNLGYGVQGAQIGLINIAEDVQGTQIGLLNFSDEVQGESVGLITYSREGRRHLEVWGDSTGFAHVGYRMGTSHIYTLFTAAYNPFSDPARWSYGLGLGGEIPLDRAFINLDAAIHDHHLGFDSWYPPDGASLIPEIRALAGYSFARRFSLYAGGSVQFFIPGWYSSDTMSGYINSNTSSSDFSVQWNLLAGLRF